MQGLILAFLGVVFLVSGTAKVRRPTLAAFALVDFGILRRAIPTVGLLIGCGEVAVGLGLVTRQFLSWSQGAAVVLLWFFCVLLGRELALGRRHPCYCFGDADDELTPRTLLRTFGLALAATWSAVLLTSEQSVQVVIGETVVAGGAFSVIALGGAYLKLREATRHHHDSSASVVA